MRHEKPNIQERPEHVFFWQDYVNRIMQETYQRPNEAVVMVDGVSISITVNATIVRTARTEGRIGRHKKKKGQTIAADI